VQRNEPNGETGRAPDPAGFADGTNGPYMTKLGGQVPRHNDIGANAERSFLSRKVSMQAQRPYVALFDSQCFNVSREICLIAQSSPK
jgi:hypothetical protein